MFRRAGTTDQSVAQESNLNHLWTDDVYIRTCKFLPPKRRMTYIYAFLVLAKRRMPFIYAKVLNGILLDFGKH